MEYDEIDQYVDQLFNRPEGGGGDDEPLTGEVLSGDWRIDRIDQIIQDTYDEAIWWHNQRISEGTDPRSGLRSLPYIPWDERIDGAAAMMGAVGDSSFERNHGNSKTRDNLYAYYIGEIEKFGVTEHNNKSLRNCTIHQLESLLYRLDDSRKPKRAGLSWAELLLVGVVLFGLLVFMAATL